MDWLAAGYSLIPRRFGLRISRLERHRIESDAAFAVVKWITAKRYA